MVGFATIAGYVGSQPAGDFFVPDTTQRHPLGTNVDGVADDFGWGSFVYGKAGAAHGVGRVVAFDGNYLASDVANTGNLGTPVAIVKANMVINSFGWFQVAGQSPVQANATVAAGAAIGIGAAGILGTNTAGKQILGARVIQSNLYAPTLANCLTEAGSKKVMVSSVNGIFVGLPVTGTGIPGGTTVAAVGASGNDITLSAAATAAGQVTLTFTWTGFSWLSYNAPHVQGAIT